LRGGRDASASRAKHSMPIDSANNADRRRQQLAFANGRRARGLVPALRARRQNRGRDAPMVKRGGVDERRCRVRRQRATRNCQCAAPDVGVDRDETNFHQQARKTSAARYYWPTREPYFDGLIDSTGKFRSRRVGRALRIEKCVRVEMVETEMQKVHFRPWKKRSARTGRAAFARAQTSGTMRTKQTRRAGAAGTRPKSDGLPYVNPLHLIGACRAAIDVSRRANNDRPVHFFRAEARRRDARRAAVRGRATRSRAADALRARIAESSATSSAPARGDAREHTPIAASSCRVARGKISSLRRRI